MNRKDVLSRIAGWMVGLAATLLAGSALAGTFVDFSGQGNVVPVGGNGAVVELSATGDYAFNGVSGWTLTSPFTFSFAANTGSGTFNFSNGAFGDSLFGTLTSTGIQGGFALQYLIGGGTGVFAGAGGSGSSTVLLLVDPSTAQPPWGYTESGRFHVPEPGTLALMGLGLAALGASRRRRPG